MKLFIVGNGGHARVIAEAAKLLGHEFSFVIQDGFESDPNTIAESAFFSQLDQAAEDWGLILGVGSVGAAGLRQSVANRYAELAEKFSTIIHPSAYVAPSAVLNRGVFVAMGAKVGTSARLDSHVIVNSGAIVDHDCHLGEGVHLAPGATLSGGVRIGPWSHIGTGATVIQGLQIAPSTVLGAGAVLIKSVLQENSSWLGVPAKPLLRP